MLALCLRAGRVLRLCRALDGAGSRAGVRRTQKGGDGLVQRITVVPNRPTSRRADTPQQPHTVSPSSGCAHRHPRGQRAARHPQTIRGQSGRHPGTHKPAEGSQIGTQAPTNQQGRPGQQRASASCIIRITSSGGGQQGPGAICYVNVPTTEEKVGQRVPGVLQAAGCQPPSITRASECQPASRARSGHPRPRLRGLLQTGAAPGADKATGGTLDLEELAPRHREGRTLYPRAAPPGSGCLPPETAPRASLAPTPVAARGAWQEAAATPLGAQLDAWVIREPSPRWVFRNW